MYEPDGREDGHGYVLPPGLIFRLKERIKEERQQYYAEVESEDEMAKPGGNGKDEDGGGQLFRRIHWR